MPDCRERSVRTRSQVLKAIPFVLPLLLAGMPLRSQEVLPYLEAGVGQKQGDFGSPVQSTLGMAYATYGAATTRWDASLTVPYFSLNREGGGLSAQDHGIGDVLARGAYRFLPENEGGWSLDGMGAVKLPTASDTKGLGTGRTDAGGFLALHQRLGSFQWTLLGGWVQGVSSYQTSTVGNLTSGAYEAGLGGAWYIDRTRWGLSFEARGAAFQGTPGAREISADVFHLFSTKWGMKAVVTAGLTDGGPKRSVGVAVIRYFQ